MRQQSYKSFEAFSERIPQMILVWKRQCLLQGYSGRVTLVFPRRSRFGPYERVVFAAIQKHSVLHCHLQQKQCLWVKFRHKMLYLLYPLDRQKVLFCAIKSLIFKGSRLKFEHFRSHFSESFKTLSFKIKISSI